jgi:hypothetical protein
MIWFGQRLKICPICAAVEALLSALEDDPAE